MNAKPFLDTNIVIYAFVAGDARRPCAEDIIGRGGTISVQVLNEFVNVARKKLRLGWDEISLGLVALETCLGRPVPVDHDVHRCAIVLARHYNFSIYDSLILSAAKISGCKILYTEDLQHGRSIEGVTILNPFLAAS